MNQGVPLSVSVAAIGLFIGFVSGLITGLHRQEEAK